MTEPTVPIHRHLTVVERCHLGATLPGNAGAHVVVNKAPAGESSLPSVTFYLTVAPHSTGYLKIMEQGLEKGKIPYQKRPAEEVPNANAKVNAPEVLVISLRPALTAAEQVAAVGNAIANVNRALGVAIPTEGFCNSLRTLHAEIESGTRTHVSAALGFKGGHTRVNTSTSKSTVGF